MEPRAIFDEYLSGTIYDEKQVDEHGVHLTVGAIWNIDASGRVDFGGSEFEPSPASEISPVKQDPGDDYGWWELEGGSYRVRFNESILPDKGTFLVVSNERILACGCGLSPTVISAGDMETILTVPEQGIRIKENARIAILREL